MQELEKILEEIDLYIEAYNSPPYGIEVDGTTDLLAKCATIIRKHMNDGWIPVENERLWNILFEEACVEGEQERRIYNRLKETFGGERSDMDGKL